MGIFYENISRKNKFLRIYLYVHACYGISRVKVQNTTIFSNTKFKILIAYTENIIIIYCILIRAWNHHQNRNLQQPH
jgi:hypothetical protein